MSDPRDPDFTDLPDLAAEAVGGAAILANDEFFAEKENLLRAHDAEWREHVYTDRGKWMDGWETRRRRDGGASDWCVIRLGLPGRVRGVVVDTSFFRGNFPESCALEGAAIDDPLDLAALERARWIELVPRAPLAGHTKNRFTVARDERVTHVRLTIFPDGGVARLRVHGEVTPDLARLRARGELDLAALEHGAWVESCSDMFFGSRNNLIKPGPSRSMADGWETRRRRGPGHDWAIIRLAAPGTIDRLELDTTHFKGNAPGRAVVEGRWDPSDDWRTLLATPTQPHTRHVFADELRRIGVVSHLRLSVFPDGGVARLRAWGTLDPEKDQAIAQLNGLGADDARASLLRCCGARRWADAMATLRPFEDRRALARLAERTWWQLREPDWLEAFAAHPKIGERPAAGWAAGEQAAATDSVAAELATLNQDYLARHGFIFITCAAGRAPAAMLDELRARVARDRDTEIRTAAEEQCRITRLRLAKLLEELA